MLVRVRADGSSELPPPPEVGSDADVEVEIEPAPAQRERSRPRGLVGALSRMLASEGKQPRTDSARSADAARPCTPDSSPEPPPEITAAAGLWQSSIEVKDKFTYSDLESIVVSCPGAKQLVLSADDIRESGQDLTLTAPNGIDLAELTLGDSVGVTATIDEQGSLSLSGVASDEGGAGANDSTSGQGDLAR